MEENEFEYVENGERKSKNLTTFMSQSITVGVKTEAMLLKVNNLYYFVEYPTNRPPNPQKLLHRDNHVVEVNEEQFGYLCSAFLEYLDLNKQLGFIHAPSFLHGYLKGVRLDLVQLGILL